ncbi:MAG TPA: DUF1028 domain-containing protein [Beijerinckiaceae bacterium]|nr:DUF1028 domain-containing protein [Beijerinckiaceae bacterium]
MTFSIAARCARTGMFGVAISSSSPAVAARCAYARAGVGAATSQNITDPRLGERLVALLAEGASATEAVEIVRRTTEHIAFRQLTAVDRNGGTAAYSGAKVLGLHAEAKGRDAVAAGNLLATEAVPERMLAAFEEAPEAHLADRLLRALRAAIEAGGEAGPVHSAGLRLVDAVSWPVADLRVDWHDDPIAQLCTLWEVYAPQLDAYVARALNPSEAPSFNVPGDP